ncbi:uncharacterized protein K452DRAFT_300748 [Aplosporella prunicola CBS 121167]|uniref:Uncharacterized protein n=1 Tax=Aplosporella prunicola CBS 121167 TaxID=1176127 RepID=A0A6A6B3L6_9PEZI|nr:uncharacterized protein K452DRAFT_300748 [Aplosporella prunicola CBS 121167]KAF2138650.1 hypothetical protein K452DRAFT_300748 [Aplosporella prunicola CBS 121167]
MPTRRRRDDDDDDSDAAAASATTVTPDTIDMLCTPYALPSGGVLTLGPSSTITLTADALFSPHCTAYDGPIRDITDVVDLQDPFHASVTPQVYATGAATVVSWMLVIMLLITPRTFFVGGAGGRSGLMGRRGMIGGASGGASVIGVGSRPWLQKVAALTVAVSMTIATADTFRVAKQQYENGYMDADDIRREVVGGLEIKISRVISDVFLLLAQVQTLIRLFPRHKEKVIIKWVGFALIILDMAFSSVNNFEGNDIGRPAHFKDAIPALAYLFELALSMLYAAWVLYYALTKRRYAFYHKLMYNISLVALLSVIAILTPIIFFATDISNYTVAGWGDYFRWVGAAAASVIVWEWVERIEALEREDKKDGILGREIFDGDEMLDVTPSAEINWPGLQRVRQLRDDRRSGGGGGSGVYASGTSTMGSGVSQRPFRMRQQQQQQQQYEDGRFIPLGPVHSNADGDTRRGSGPAGSLDTRGFPGSPTTATPARPAPIATPVSRTDSASVDSTVYAVRYHSVADATPRQQQPPTPAGQGPDHIRFDLGPSRSKQAQDHDGPADLERQQRGGPERANNALWRALARPFKRRRTTPPPEILGARIIEPAAAPSTATTTTTTGETAEDSPGGGDRPERRELRQAAQNYAWWDVKGRMGAMAGEVGEVLLERTAAGRLRSNNNDAQQPITVIPAQPRGGRAWSPDALTALSVSAASSPARSSQREERGEGDGDSEVEWGMGGRDLATTPQQQRTTPAVSSPLAREAEGGDNRFSGGGGAEAR